MATFENLRKIDPELVVGARKVFEKAMSSAPMKDNGVDLGALQLIVTMCINRIRDHGNPGQPDTKELALALEKLQEARFWMYEHIHKAGPWEIERNMNDRILLNLPGD